MVFKDGSRRTHPGVIKNKGANLNPTNIGETFRVLVESGERFPQEVDLAFPARNLGLTREGAMALFVPPDSNPTWLKESELIRRKVFKKYVALARRSGLELGDALVSDLKDARVNLGATYASGISRALGDIKDGSEIQANPVFRHETSYGSLVLNPRRGEIYSPLLQRVVSITQTHVFILEQLINTPGGVVSTDELYRIRWGFPPPSNEASRTYITHIVYLRKLLGEDGKNQLIHNIRGSGYFLDRSTLRAAEASSPATMSPDSTDRQSFRTEGDGKIVLYPRRGIVVLPIRPGEEVQLTQAEMRIFESLVRHPMMVFRPNLLAETLNINPASVKSLVGSLRQKLGDSPTLYSHFGNKSWEHGGMVRTRRDYGYFFYTKSRTRETAQSSTTLTED